MPIAFSTIVVWIAVTVFFWVPKKLTPLEMIFLFFIDTICELGTFSILSENLKLIQVKAEVGVALADLMYRLIELPLLLVSTSNILMHSSKWVKWGGCSAIVLFSLAVQWILIRQKMLTFHHWNLLYSCIYLVVFIAFSFAMAWLIIRTSPKGIDKNDRL